MITRLQSPIIAAVIGVVLYSVVTWLVLNPAGVAREAVVKEPREERNLPLTPSWEYRNPELDQMLAEVKEERELLRTRAKDLEHLKARIEAEWQELSAATQMVAQLQADLDHTLITVKQDELVNLKRLARLYTNMKPDSAARILGELEEGHAVRILSLMKESESAAVLESLAKQDSGDIKRVARLSSQVRTFQTRPGDNKE
jgi:flagellar motility protein MotE (MotC chaperone)